MPEGKPGKFSTARVCEVVLGMINRQERRTIGRRGELTAGSEAVGHEALEEDRVEVRTSEVDGGGVPCRSRADDDLH